MDNILINLVVVVDVILVIANFTSNKIRKHVIADVLPAPVQLEQHGITTNANAYDFIITYNLTYFTSKI
jgi:hypothetical protein